MRKVAVMAGILAALLTLAGCGVSNGPSKADVATVKEALADLPEGWSLSAVHANDSSSEGFSRHLSITMEHAGKATSADLREALEAVLLAVPADAGYYMTIWIEYDTVDARYPDLAGEFRELGLGDSSGDHERGMLYVTRSELESALARTP